MLAMWLLLLAAVQVLALVLVWRFFVRTEHGQLLDFIALSGNSIGQNRVDGLVNNVLNAMSVVALAVATAVIGFIALARGRILLGVLATLLVVGANLTAQGLKYVITRPDLGVDAERAAAGNSMPSGHVALAASVAIAFVMVLPPRLRGAGGLIGVAYASLAGVATMSAGWHRPSDAVAALLIVGAWAAGASFLLVVAQREDAVVEREEAHRFSVLLLFLGGAALLAVCAVALKLTDQVLSTPPDQLSRNRLLAAYGGSAAGIAGTASLVMALVLVTMHRVVPRRPIGRSM
jgi:membrane-associated phospholipid phosphatase